MVESISVNSTEPVVLVNQGPSVQWTKLVENSTTYRSPGVPVRVITGCPLVRRGFEPNTGRVLTTRLAGRLVTIPAVLLTVTE